MRSLWIKLKKGHPRVMGKEANINNHNIVNKIKLGKRIIREIKGKTKNNYIKIINICPYQLLKIIRKIVELTHKKQHPIMQDNILILKILLDLLPNIIENRSTGGMEQFENM